MNMRPWGAFGAKSRPGRFHGVPGQLAYSVCGAFSAEHGAPRGHFGFPGGHLGVWADHFGAPGVSSWHPSDDFLPKQVQFGAQGGHLGALGVILEPAGVYFVTSRLPFRHILE